MRKHSAKNRKKWLKCAFSGAGTFYRNFANAKLFAQTQSLDIFYLRRPQRIKKYQNVIQTRNLRQDRIVSAGLNGGGSQCLFRISQRYLARLYPHKIQTI